MESFEDFVKRENQKKTDSPFNPQETINRYIHFVNSFFKMVEHNWLFPFISKGEINIVELERPVTEQFLGQYIATEKVILIGNKSVYIRPMGALLSGSYGRIDLIYEARSEMFVLVPPSIKTPKQLLGSIHYQQGELQSYDLKNDLEWKYVSKYPKLRYEIINSDVFQRVLMEIIHG